VPLLFAWWSGATYAFVGTAKSDYWRDEAGPLLREHWWQRWEVVRSGIPFGSAIDGSSVVKQFFRAIA